MEQHMIRAMCEVRVVARVPSDVLRERMSFVVKIKEILVHTCLQ